MLTPQQINNKTAFPKARLGGYDIQAVDAFLAPLTEDYIALYNENIALKSKLAKKLEQERTNAGKLVAAENARVEAARTAANQKIAEILEQMRLWVDTLEQIQDGKITEAPTLAPVPEQPKLVGKASIDRPWLKFFPAGADQMTIPQVSLCEYLKMMCKGEELTVLHYYGTDISWATFFSMVDKTACAMRAAGLGEGDQIPVLLRAVPEFLIILLAAEKIGASLLCRDNSIPENAEAINKTNAKIMFAHDFITRAEVDAYTKAGINKIITVDPWALAVKSEMPDHIIRNLNSRYTESKVRNSAIVTWEGFIAASSIYIGKVSAEEDCNRPLFRAYTSGSTGTSKQVIHSAKSMLGVIHQLAPYASSDEFRPTALITILPPALIAVTVSMLLMPMASNKLLILDPFVDEFDIDLEMMRYKPNMWPLIPMFTEILMRSKRIPADYDMSHLLACGSGAEGFNNGQIRRAQKFLNDHNCNVTYSVSYGQSEAASNITFPCPLYPMTDGNVGIPMPLVNMGIFRGTKEVGYNVKGEICITSPGLMLGYDNEEATAKTLIRHEDGNLWLHTGDTGYVTEDGVFFALGRGMNKRYDPIDPEASERLVEIDMENRVADAEIPGILDQFFVIVPDKEHRGYFIPYLYVVLKDGYTVRSIQEDVYAALNTFEHPVEIIQVPERPFYHFKTNRLHLEAPYARY